MFDTYTDILNIDDLCTVLKIGKNTAYKLLKSGEIKSLLVAGKYRIPKQQLIEYINRRERVDSSA